MLTRNIVFEIHIEFDKNYTFTLQIVKLQIPLPKISYLYIFYSWFDVLLRAYLVVEVFLETVVNQGTYRFCWSCGVEQCSFWISLGFEEVVDDVLDSCQVPDKSEYMNIFDEITKIS